MESISGLIRTRISPKKIEIFLVIKCSGWVNERKTIYATAQQQQQPKKKSLLETIEIVNDVFFL